MSKKNKKKTANSRTTSKSRNQTRAEHKGTQPLLNRRNALKLLIAVPTVGVAGAAIHRYDVQNRERHDLSAIGQGLPAVVQVHDPSCPSCKRLMNNTRKALKGQENIVYRIADLTSNQGADFARKHNAEKVTLLIFDKKGKHIDRIEGVTTVDELQARFNEL